MQLTATAIASSLHVDGQRLWQSLMDLANIGATAKGGVCRVALTDEDQRGRDQVVQWFKQAGLEVRVDAIGNVFGRRAGTDPHAPAVATGSHIDTQPTGGKFDGNYGVMAGLEVVRTLNAHGIQTRAPIEVAFWTNEEGSRFVPVMMGSGAFIGVFGASDMHQQQDTAGVTVGAELQRIGYLGDVACGDVPNGPFAAYFEAHIEQGPVLEAYDKPIGIVSGALGQQWYDITVQGMEAHAGPTPMELRHDALLVAARMMDAVNRIALDEAPHGRGTVGYVQVHPNSRNVIPGQVKFSVDFRHLSQEGLDRMDHAMHAQFDALAAQCQCTVAIAQVVKFEPCIFHPDCVASVRAATQQLGYDCMDVVSGAGHDAVYINRVAPSAMIFVPCKDGISHNEIEDAKPEHLAAGCNVLLHAMLAQAGVVD